MGSPACTGRVTSVPDETIGLLELEPYAAIGRA